MESVDFEIVQHIGTVPGCVGNGNRSGAACVDREIDHVLVQDERGGCGFRVGSDGLEWAAASATRCSDRTKTTVGKDVALGVNGQSVVSVRVQVADCKSLGISAGGPVKNAGRHQFGEVCSREVGSADVETVLGPGEGYRCGVILSVDQRRRCRGQRLQAVPLSASGGNVLVPGHLARGGGSGIASELHVDYFRARSDD